MIQNIVFDMGGVLIAWDPARIVARIGAEGEDARLLLREIFGSVEWVSLDRGTLSESQALARFRDRLPLHLHEAAERCVFWWKEPLWPIPGMAELVGELADRGYGIYLLSNATSALHRYFPRIPGSEHFQGMLVSADRKLLKPQHEIYEALFAAFGLDPAACLFVDDSPANAEGAIRLGMQAHVFYGDTARLRRELRAAGLAVKE